MQKNNCITTQGFYGTGNMWIPEGKELCLSAILLENWLRMNLVKPIERKPIERKKRGRPRKVKVNTAVTT